VSKFINLSGMQTIADATNDAGVRVELCERTGADGKAVKYVRLFEGGAGTWTEQFSGYRTHEANVVFLELVRRHAATLAVRAAAPAAAPKAKAPKQPKAARPVATDEEVVYEAGTVRVVKVSGKPVTFRTLVAGAVVDTVTCAPQSWKKTQAAVVAAAQAR
jgi:hypothetical protein